MWKVEYNLIRNKSKRCEVKYYKNNNIKLWNSTCLAYTYVHATISVLYLL